MEKRLNIICSLRFTRLTDVILYHGNHDGTATVETIQWTALPIHEGSGRMSVSGPKINGVQVFRSQIRARLKEIITTGCVGLIQVDICGSGTYLIGTPDLPVSIEPTYSLTSKTIEITHENTHFPLKTAI